MIKNDINKKFYFPIASRIILIVYILVFGTSFFLAWQYINISKINILENTVDMALNEQFRVGYAIKKMAENLYYSNDDVDTFLSGTIKNSAYSYAEYYTENSSFGILTKDNKTSLFSNIPEKYLPIFELNPEKDGSAIYFTKKIADKTLIFVSSSIKIYHNTFRLDYVKDVSSISNLLENLAWKIAFTLFYVEIFLLICLYLSIKRTLKPLDNLNKHTEEIAKGNYDKRVPLLHNDEFGRLSLSFNDMTDAIEQQVFLLSESAYQKELFASNLAHEIKTPITSIVAYSDFAVKSELKGEELYKLLEYIRKEGQRLSQLSEKILKWSTLSHNKAVIAPCRTERIIEQVLYTLKPLANKRNQKIEITNNTNLLYTDESLIVSLIINLCKNALNASYDNSSIHLKITILKDIQIISVTDCGIGIDESELNKIIKPFYMIDKSRDRSKDGSGLGLSFCHAIVEAHNGNMKIESSLGKGTCVTVKIKIFKMK